MYVCMYVYAYINALCACVGVCVYTYRRIHVPYHDNHVVMRVLISFYIIVVEQVLGSLRRPFSRCVDSS